MNCTICSTSIPTQLYHIHIERENQRYYRCINCHSIAMHPEDYLSREKEKARYLTHNNDVNDTRYQMFVSPVVQAITTHTNINHIGLDYGAGTGPVITKLLRDKGYSMTTYDPFFIPNVNALSNTYDFIVCCEVAEHFHKPQWEIKQFYRLLNKSGLLFIKTELVVPEIDFSSWYYAKDPTHTIFYSPKGIKILLNRYQFKEIAILRNLVIAKKM